MGKRPEPAADEQSRPFEDDGEQGLGALAQSVREAMDAEQLPVATKLAERLVEKYPESTTAHETMGDVMVARGNHGKAQEHYAQALELEPANVDAERKHAEAMLLAGEAERTRRALESGETSELRGAVHKTPQGAASRSVFFPGLGQLYNGDYEKGLPAAVAGFVFLGVAVWGIGEFLGAQLAQGEAMTTLEAMFAILGTLGYVIVWGWSVWDAHRSAEEL